MNNRQLLLQIVFLNELPLKLSQKLPNFPQQTQLQFIEKTMSLINKFSHAELQKKKEWKTVKKNFHFFFFIFWMLRCETRSVSNTVLVQITYIILSYVRVNTSQWSLNNISWNRTIAHTVFHVNVQIHHYMTFYAILTAIVERLFVHIRSKTISLQWSIYGSIPPAGYPGCQSTSRGEGIKSSKSVSHIFSLLARLTLHWYLKKNSTVNHCYGWKRY